MGFSIGSKVWTPDSVSMGQGVVVEVGTDNDVKVAHIDIRGNKREKWFDGSVVQAAPTKEQLEVQASNVFRAKHLNDFNPCQSNVQMMTDHMRANRWPWTAENLERAFTTLKSQLAPLPAVRPATPAVVAAPAAPVAPAPVIPAPSALVFTLTKRQVAAASKEQLKDWMADKPAGAVQALEALGIRTKLPPRWRQ